MQRKIDTRMRSDSTLTLRARLILVVMFGLCLVNAVLHNPYVGYDVDDHIAYLETLAQARLPWVEDSDEFFSPPLPYVLPAIFIGLLNLSTFLTLKLAQIINAFLALGSAFIITRMVDREAEGSIVPWTFHFSRC